MRYDITGADKNSGLGVYITVEADDLATARQIAHNQGIYVSEIAPERPSADRPARSATATTLTSLLALFIVIACVGGLATFIEIFARSGLGQMRNIAWPVGATRLAVRLPDGRYAVQIDSIDRIQIYSPHLEFQHGFQPEIGDFVLSTAPEGNLQIFQLSKRTTGQGRHCVYSPDGTLMIDDLYDRQDLDNIRANAHHVPVYIPCAWWERFFLNPVYSMLMLAAGVFPTVALYNLRRRLPH